MLQEGNAEYTIKDDLVVHYDDMVRIIETGSHQIVDARDAENFFGEAPEPSDGKYFGFCFVIDLHIRCEI